MELHLTPVLALLAVLGMGAQWLGWRLHMPAIVMLTLAGLLAGPVTGWIRPSADLGAALEPIIKLSVAAILFEGGLSLRLHELRQAAAGVRRLITLGVVFSLLLGALAAHYVGGLAWPVALVFGAIIVVTGPTVIIPLLRQARLKRRPASYLKWEGIVNDPTGAILAVLAFEYFVQAESGGLSHILLRLGLGLAVACALGGGVAWLLGWAYRRGAVPEYLKGPLALAAAFAVYALANGVLEEAGLLAATLLGVVLGNLNLPSIEEIRRFKEYIAILLVSAVFLLLTADLDPAILQKLDWRSAALLAAVLLLVRPLAIYAATVGAGMDPRERLLVAWVAPRGVVAAAVAGVFGPALEAQGYPGAELLLPLVFALILLTVVVHGFSLPWVARRLELSAKSRNGVLIVGANPWTTGLARVLKEQEVPVILVDSSWHRLRTPRLEGIRVFYGELLSEQAEQSLEFNEVGTLLAATDNDAYNALVCSRYAAELGRNRVFQLPPPGVEERESRQVARSARGLYAMAEVALYEELLAHWYRGWSFQKTRLSESFDFEACRAACPAEAIMVLLIKESGAVRFSAVDEPLKPDAGDLVVWFGPRQEKAVRGERLEEAANGDGAPAPGDEPAPS